MQQGILLGTDLGKLRIAFWTYVVLAITGSGLITARKLPEPQLRSEKSSQILNEAEPQKTEQGQV